MKIFVCTHSGRFTLCFSAYALYLPLGTACNTFQKKSDQSKRTIWNRARIKPKTLHKIFKLKNHKVIQNTGVQFNVEVFANPPGLCHIQRLASAVDSLQVSRADLGGTYSHEIRSWATNSELGEVRQRLADSSSKQEGSHYFVECSYILVEVRIRVNLLAVDQISFSRRYLKEKWQSKIFKFAILDRQCIKIYLKAILALWLKLTMMTVQEMVTAASMP